MEAIFFNLHSCHTHNHICCYRTRVAVLEVLYAYDTILQSFDRLQVAQQLERTSVSIILWNNQVSHVCVCYCLCCCLPFPMSLCYEWPMASWNTGCVSWLDKHDYFYQTGATAWRLSADVPKCHLLLFQNVTLGTTPDCSVWTSFLHALQNPFTNGMFVNEFFCNKHNLMLAWFIFSSSALLSLPLHVLLSKP